MTTCNMAYALKAEIHGINSTKLLNTMKSTYISILIPISGIGKIKPVFKDLAVTNFWKSVSTVKHKI